MSKNTHEHYENHLAENYKWMFGNFDSQVEFYKDIFDSHLDQNSKIAIDLGCGNGIQSIALAQKGYKVYAVDFSETLLDELEQNKGEHSLHIIESDIMDFENFANLSPSLIICMGDTLTHLDSTNDIKSMFSFCKRELAHKGKLIISYRDMSSRLEGDSRFINVRSDSSKILTCFLEYEDNHVIVHDIFHKLVENNWKLSVSSYKKLILPENEIKSLLKKTGFDIESTSKERGFTTIIATI